MAIISGYVFDHAISDETLSTNDIIERFTTKYQSIYKVCLPMAKDSGRDFRKSFLDTAGRFSDENLDRLHYLRCVSYNPEKGNMDILKFKHNNDFVNRRFPFYLINCENIQHSNADEFDIDLRIKVEGLLREISGIDWKFSSRGEMGKRKIRYEFFETQVDLTDYSDSREYKQVKLLLACVHDIKQKEYKRSSDLTPVKMSKVEEETTEVPLVSIKRSPALFRVEPITPNVSAETNLLTSMHLTEVSPIGRKMVEQEQDLDLAKVLDLTSNSPATPEKRKRNK